MSDLAKLCCFVCPKGDYAEKSLSQPCESCGRPYRFPLEHAPEKIGEYRVLEPLGRGFYAATYIVEKIGALRTKQVLKVSPVGLYAFFKKNFEAEAQQHFLVAEGADYVAAIRDMFDAPVKFADLELQCHVAVLDFIEGKLLADYLSGREPLRPETAAQIAADLFRLKAEFESRTTNHNDLHAANIIVAHLTPARARQGVIDPLTRAVAIDLGSLAPDRRSGGDHLGDLHWIAQHVDEMANILLSVRGGEDDTSARVGFALRTIAQMLTPPTEGQRTPTADDFVSLIEEAYYRSAQPWRPWRSDLRLRTFNADYNAQTLDAWHVPKLLVDPEGAWISKVSAPGPLIVTGMRGCGKTLLLRALQFHARATVLQGESDSTALERIKSDNYVGLFVSAQRLLDPVIKADAGQPDPFARLFVAYALEAVRAAAHLEDLTPGSTRGVAQLIRHAIAEVLNVTVSVDATTTNAQIEREVTSLLHRASRSDSDLTCKMHASHAFPVLADAVRRMSEFWSSAQILFLLDDVSTRFLKQSEIEDLLSALIFQHPSCAFKITSEAQTLFLGLTSPGRVEPAAQRRDYDTFDLGAEVIERITGHGGKKFVESILQQRADHFAGHPKATPSQLLGDIDLETIAKTIIATRDKRNSPSRKSLYHGMSVLAAVCVGDIGSVITLYESIVKRARQNGVALPTIQNDVFQEFCAKELYRLDRRGARLKDFAISFAQASYELLVQSQKNPKESRLRQYLSVYVRVTTGNVDEQMAQLRELIDAGIFVFSGGAPRTKTRDSNPIQHFKLKYRKLYGLASFIGLAERDRFELSGKDLEEWLTRPEDGKTILMRNLSVDVNVDVDAAPNPAPTPSTKAPRRKGKAAQELTADLFEERDGSGKVAIAPFFLPQVKELALPALKANPPSTLVVGLGFEDRAAGSLARVLGICKPRKIIALKYPLAGKTRQMLRDAEAAGVELQQLTYDEFFEADWVTELDRDTVVDISGLAKPPLFFAVRQLLSSKGRMRVVYSKAADYYPRDTDLEPVLNALESGGNDDLLASLKDILKGEAGPYRLVPLLPPDADNTRARILCAFASPKHERLMHIVETRDADGLNIFLNSFDNARSKVAQFAAEIAAQGHNATEFVSQDASDPAQIIEGLALAYRRAYIGEGANFEIALTGNKLEALATAALAARVRTNQVWYVSPAKFDTRRFTNGIDVTRLFEIE